MSRACRLVPLSFQRATDRAWRPITHPILISDDEESQPEYTSMKLTRPGTVATNYRSQSKFFTLNLKDIIYLII